jgi:hypothetical protein
MLVAEHKWTLKSKIVDLESAFLNDNPEEEIYMDCQDGMEHAPADCLLLLKQFTVWLSRLDNSFKSLYRFFERLVLFQALQTHV